MTIKIEFEKAEDFSGDGTIILSKDGKIFFVSIITHTKQKELMDEIVGEYKKI